MRRSKAHCSVAVRDRRPTTRRGFSSASREIVYYGIDVVRQPTLTGSRKHGHHPGGTAEYEPTPGNASISRRFTLLGITLVTKMWSQVMDAEVICWPGCVPALEQFDSRRRSTRAFGIVDEWGQSPSGKRQEGVLGDWWSGSLGMGIRVSAVGRKRLSIDVGVLFFLRRTGVAGS